MRHAHADTGRPVRAMNQITGQAQAQRSGSQRIVGARRHYSRQRIALGGMFLPGKPVEVKWKGKLRKKPVTQSKKVLLEEFVERFDRTFLPVAEIRVP